MSIHIFKPILKNSKCHDCLNNLNFRAKNRNVLQMFFVDFCTESTKIENCWTIFGVKIQTYHNHHNVLIFGMKIQTHSFLKVEFLDAIWDFLTVCIFKCFLDWSFDSTHCAQCLKITEKVAFNIASVAS